MTHKRKSNCGQFVHNSVIIHRNRPRQPVRWDARDFRSQSDQRRNSRWSSDPRAGRVHLRRRPRRRAVRPVSVASSVNNKPGRGCPSRRSSSDSVSTFSEWKLCIESRGTRNWYSFLKVLAVLEDSCGFTSVYCRGAAVLSASFLGFNFVFYLSFGLGC